MIRSAARLRRWVLWAAPLMVLCARRLHAGGAELALGLWMVLGTWLPGKAAYPHAVRRRVGFHRLFFSWALGSFLFQGSAAALARFIGPNALGGAANAWLLCMGSAGFSLPVCAKMLMRPPPRRIAWGGGIVMSILCLLLIVYMR